MQSVYRDADLGLPGIMVECVRQELDEDVVWPDGQRVVLDERFAAPCGVGRVADVREAEAWVDVGCRCGGGTSWHCVFARLID